LLDSPEERVQYHCLRALRWLLWASKDDKKKNEKDQAMVVKHAIPKALKTLSKSTDKRLRRAASNLILTLSEWEIIWRKEYAGTLSSDVRTQCVSFGFPEF